jgi:hypothetical protein
MYVNFSFTFYSAFALLSFVYFEVAYYKLISEETRL